MFLTRQSHVARRKGVNASGNHRKIATHVQQTAQICLTPTAPLQRDFTAALWRLYRTHGALRLRRHLRPPRRSRRRRTACAPTCSTRCASKSTPPCATPVATSSAATTGWTASAPRINARAAANWPGNRSKPTSSAPTSLSTSAARSTLPMLGVNMGTGTSRLPPIWSNIAMPHRHLLRRSARQPRLRRPAQRQVLVRGQRNGRPLADRPPRDARIRRKALEAAKMMKWHDPSIKTDAVRFVQRPDAHLPGMGSHGAGMPGRRSIITRSTTMPATATTTLPASWPAPSKLESYVDTLASTLRYVKAKTRSKHDVYLSWDEWQVWYKGDAVERQLDGSAPPERGNLQPGRCAGRGAVAQRLPAQEPMCSRLPAWRRSSTSSPGCTPAPMAAQVHPSFYPFKLVSNHAKRTSARSRWSNAPT
jgi:hypothetical protein